MRMFVQSYLFLFCTDAEDRDKLAMKTHTHRLSGDGSPSADTLHCPPACGHIARDHFQGPSMITQNLIRPLGLQAPLNHTITLNTDPGTAFIPAISEQPQTEHRTKRRMGFLSSNISFSTRLFSSHGLYTIILTGLPVLLSILLTLIRMEKNSG